MNSFLVRALFALALAALLWMQARGVQAQPRRRLAFELAAGALLAFAALNGGLAAGLDYGWLQISLGVIGSALFVGAIAALLSSISRGEATVERDQIAAAAREYRARRERDRR